MGRQLEEGLRKVGAVFQQHMQQGREAREVAALFELYRQRRAADGPRSPDRARREEMDAMLLAALHGYDTSLLSDLIVFGEWLHDAASPIWQARPIR